MPRTDEIYGGNWLEKEDLGDRQVTVTIESVTVHDMGDGKRKAALHFVGKEKALLLNVTNASVLEGVTGTKEMDDWAGTRCVLYNDPSVMYQGKRVGGLRVKASAQRQPSHNASRDFAAVRPKPAPVPVQEPDDELSNDHDEDEADAPF